MQEITIFVAFVISSMASWAWYGAQPPKYSRGQKWSYGLIALGCWILMFVLGNI